MTAGMKTRLGLLNIDADTVSSSLPSSYWATPWPN